MLHVADDKDAGDRFLRTWASDHDLVDAELRVTTGDVQTEIATAATGATLMLIGATERGVLSRLFRGSLVLDVIEEIECSVILAEKRHKRSLRERLFGVKYRTDTPAEKGVTPDATTPEVDE